MKHYKYLLAFLLGVMVMPASAQVSNDNEDGVNKIDTRWAQNDYVPGQVLVKFKDVSRVQVRRSQGNLSISDERGVISDKLTSLLQKYGTDEMEQLLPHENPNRQMRRARAYNGEDIQERDLSQLYCLKLSAEHQHETMQMIEELNALDAVEYAEPNYYCYIMGSYIGGEGVSANPLLDSQWYLSAYGVKELWDQPIVDSERPVIAIIDTGVDTEHPDLKDNCIAGYDFVNNTANVKDDNMHGTHVAGIAAACNNETGIVGANPLALIMPVKVLDKNGRGNTATILQGVNYAVEHGAKILNLSLGGYGYSKAAADVYRNASLSAVIVAAAGNDGKCIYASHTGLVKHGIRPEPAFPAAYSFVLGVQATDRYGNLTPFSNYDDDGPLFSCEASLEEPEGFNYELKAPGKDILSTLPGGKYGELDGTSMASPLAAGAISALMMVKQYDTREQLWADLLNTDNIAQAFYLEEIPGNLEITRVMLRNGENDFVEETEDDYLRNNEVKAGETINIYPVVRCTYGEASNIKMRIDVAENEDPGVVQILTNEVDFGWHLDTFGRGVSKNPLVIRIPDDIPDARHISMKISLSCDELEQVGTTMFTLKASNFDGLHGIITEDMTLTADRVYYVDDDLTIDEGATLTIEPGTRMEFFQNKRLISNGRLVAKGTPEKPIVLTSHVIGEAWGGISSYESYTYQACIYMNSDTTLFSILPTELTPIKAEGGFRKEVYYSEWEDIPSKTFYMQDYLEDWDDDENLLTMPQLQEDPYFLTPAFLKGIKEWKDYCAQYSTDFDEMKNLSAYVFFDFFRNVIVTGHPIDTLSYCKIEDASLESSSTAPYMKDCILKGCGIYLPFLRGVRNVITESAHLYYDQWVGTKPNTNYMGKKQRNWNYVNNNSQYYNSDSYKYASWQLSPKYSDLMESNYLNNILLFRDTKKEFCLMIRSDKPEVDHSEFPSYIGTGREDLIRPFVSEFGNSYITTWGTIDLSNMRTIPVSEAHGIVWRVLVNGKDAQDEYEDLAPLGVGKHKFEVYFNRPMNKNAIPQISFGVRDPWTQNSIDEDGCWNAEGTIYTVYKTITGKTNSDGVNRIYVRGAEDNEYFECPYEKRRFNINVQAAGSMATGFAAESSLSRVILTWDNSQNDIEDAMGYNVYRYNNEKTKTMPGRWENGNWYAPYEVPDTIRINQDILGVETSEYVDYDVEPGHTYYYLYKVLSTDLKEYDVSNIVTATPLTATLGDANGSGEVDVVDVVTTVNYAMGMNPSPFIFDAADMNADKSINILDVIGIVQKILYPNAASTALAGDLQAVYTIEDGVLYVESPVALAGVQAQVNSLTPNPSPRGEESIAVASDLDGFEHASAWLSENDMLFLAYSMNGKTLTPGKHALLYIGDSELSSIRLADVYGRNVMALAGEGATAVDNMGSKVQTQKGIYDLQGRKLSPLNSHLSTLKKGIYIINGKKVVK